MKKTICAALALAVFFTVPAFAKGGQASRGGHYAGGKGSPHKGGHYKNSRTNDHYQKHK